MATGARLSFGSSTTSLETRPEFPSTHTSWFLSSPRCVLSADTRSFPSCSCGTPQRAILWDEGQEDWWASIVNPTDLHSMIAHHHSECRPTQKGQSVSYMGHPKLSSTGWVSARTSACMSDLRRMTSTAVFRHSKAHALSPDPPEALTVTFQPGCSAVCPEGLLRHANQRQLQRHLTVPTSPRGIPVGDFPSSSVTSGPVHDSWKGDSV